MAKPKQRAHKPNPRHQDHEKSKSRNIIKRNYSQPISHPKPITKHHQPSQQAPKIPFNKKDRILTVGEGDFSFALSLKQHHKLRHIVATSYENQNDLAAKYGRRVMDNISHLRSDQTENRTNLAQGSSDPIQEDEGEEEEWNGFSSPSSPSSSISDESFSSGDFIFRDDLLHPPHQEDQRQTNQHHKITVHHDIDATRLKLPQQKKKLLAANNGGPFTKIVFNFPHVGGKSTDINRQVRANQELLVGFFNAAKDLLASPSNPARKSENDEDEDENEESDEVDFDLSTGEPLDLTTTAIANSSSPISSENERGRILITLFEGEPYTLWNIRDLARHCGLRVVESFRFPWSAYPGYTHARTIGNIIGAAPPAAATATTMNGKRPGKWRGEERDARTYVLVVKDVEEEKASVVQGGDVGTGGNQTPLGVGREERKKGKRKRKDEDGSDSDESD